MPHILPQTSILPAQKINLLPHTHHPLLNPIPLSFDNPETPQQPQPHHKSRNLPYHTLQQNANRNPKKNHTSIKAIKPRTKVPQAKHAHSHPELNREQTAKPQTREI